MNLFLAVRLSMVWLGVRLRSWCDPNLTTTYTLTSQTHCSDLTMVDSYWTIVLPLTSTTQPNPTQPNLT